MPTYRHILGRKLSEDEANVLLAMGVKDGDGIWADPLEGMEGAIMFDNTDLPQEEGYTDWSAYTDNVWLLHTEEIKEWKPTGK